MSNQLKGAVSFVYGAIAIKGLAESSITYDIGELGDSVSSFDAIVHVKRNKLAVLSSVTINVVKGTEGLDALLLQIQSDINFPLSINDTGTGFVGGMPSANATQISVGDSSGDSSVETYSFTFKGNLQILAM